MNTFTEVGSTAQRLERRMVDPVALREAVINAIVHNDYSHGAPPVFEIYSNRLSIVSYGGLIEQVNKLVSVMQTESPSTSLMSILHLNSRQYFVSKYLNPAIEAGFIELTQPDSPKSPTQKYRLTPKGQNLKQQLSDNNDNKK